MTHNFLVYGALGYKFHTQFGGKSLIPMFLEGFTMRMLNYAVTTANAALAPGNSSRMIGRLFHHGISFVTVLMNVSAGNLRRFQPARNCLRTTIRTAWWPLVQMKHRLLRRINQLYKFPKDGTANLLQQYTRQKPRDMILSFA